MPQHNIPPVYDAHSRVLILGSFPSVKSREAGFYYAHPQNRFWPMLAAVLHAPLPHTTEEKRALLLAHGLALWDAAAECELTGSSDASITRVVPNDLRPLLRTGDLRAVLCNGGTAHALYQKHLFAQTLLPAQKLPSTSPANARSTLPALIEAWSAALAPLLA